MHDGVLLHEERVIGIFVSSILFQERIDFHHLAWALRRRKEEHTVVSPCSLVRTSLKEVTRLCVHSYPRSGDISVTTLELWIK